MSQKTKEQIKESIIDGFDREVEHLSQQDYADLLDDLIGDFQARLDCVNEEMSDTDGD